MSVLFIDCETTGLEPRRHVPWEVAIIEPDGTEHLWCWRPSAADMRRAEPKALEVGEFLDRAPANSDPDVEWTAAVEIAALLEGNTLVGVNVSFDAAMLTTWLRWHGQVPGWHYRTVSVEVMAAGWLHGRPDPNGLDTPVDHPWRSEDLSRACGIEPPAGPERHTALGDARWVARWYRRLTGEVA